MTDKEKIKAEIKRQIAELTPTKEKIGIVGGVAVKRHLESILSFIDSLQEEPVSKDLEEAAKDYLYSNILYDDVYVGNLIDKDCIEMFKAGAQWQKEHLWKLSENQIEAMDTLIVNLDRNPLLLDNFTQANLRILHDDLKKLKG